MEIIISDAKTMALFNRERGHPQINNGVSITECGVNEWSDIVDLIVRTLKENGYVANIRLNRDE